MRDRKSFMQNALALTKGFDGPPPPIVPFADWDYYYMRENLEWRSDESPSRTVTVPKGFVTDLASVPRIFWEILPPTARYSYPSVVHDYLYWFQPCDRHTADDVLKVAMHEMEVPEAQILAIHTALRLRGGVAWSSNATARANGERRVLKKFPLDFTTTWKIWKSTPEVFAE